MATCRRPTNAAHKEAPETVGHRRTATAFAEPLSDAVAVPPDAYRPGADLFELEEFLPPIPEAVPAARRHVTRVLDEWGLSSLTETAALVTCELVSNAVKHGSPAARTVKWEDRAQQIVLKVRQVRPYEGVLFIEVRDPGSKGLHPRLRTAAPHDEVGRGLYLVDALSRAWGHYSPAYGGRAVWCELLSQK
jgi:anti-sigma regulatory factor (Ser/Thr protein kinase)